MTSMIERMARAMDPELFAREDAARAKGDPLALKCFAWQYAEAVSSAYAKALAALREMREPSNEMIGAMRVHAVPKTQGLGAAFTAAIDAEIAAYEADRASPVLRPPS